MALSTKILKAFIYATSLVLFLFGGLAIYWFLGDHELFIGIILGYAFLSIFFFSMKLFLFSSITKKMSGDQNADG